MTPLKSNMSLPRLLREPLLDVGVFEERQWPGTEHRRFDTRGRVPGGSVTHPGQVFHRLLAMGGLHRRPFERLHLGPPPTRRQIVHNALNLARIHGITREDPGIKPLRIARLGEQGLRLRGIVRIRLQGQGKVIRLGDNPPSSFEYPRVSASLRAWRLRA